MEELAFADYFPSLAENHSILLLKTQGAASGNARNPFD
jgi:hypothetical protein